MASTQFKNDRRVIDQQPDVNDPPEYASHDRPPTGGYRPLNTTCPPGLEYLMPLDMVLLDQRVDPFEDPIGKHETNRYKVVDARGQPLYVTREHSSSFMKMALGRLRSFEMVIYDWERREALTIKRPLRFIGNSMEVYCNGTLLLGTIEETIMSLTAHYRICDGNGVEKLQIRRPRMWLMCGTNFEFEVISPNGTHVGKVQRTWSEIGRKIFTNGNIFGVSFPRDLSVKMKAMLLATAILIDFDHVD